MQKNIQKNQDYRKHLGNSQNFLTRRALIQKILNLSSINHNDTIVEIGTGKGHLTQALCQSSMNTRRQSCPIWIIYVLSMGIS